MKTEIENVKKAKETYRKHMLTLVEEAFTELGKVDYLLDNRDSFKLTIDTVIDMLENIGIFSGDPTLLEMIERVVMLGAFKDANTPLGNLMIATNGIVAKKAGILGEIVTKVMKQSLTMMERVNELEKKKNNS